MSSKEAQRGVFIVFEGIDRCGKSTQAKTLVEKLNQNGKPTKFMRFPSKYL
jgi:dTMP kinase